MPIPLRSDFGASHVLAEASRSKDGPQARRLLALAAIYDGASRTEAARIGGVTLQIRALADLVRKRRKPIVLIVDEAHDLRQDTLTSLKRLIETAADGDGKISVLLAGHPKLRRDLRSPTMEEIGYRTTVRAYPCGPGATC